jgi:hypothetical protein
LQDVKHRTVALSVSFSTRLKNRSRERTGCAGLKRLPRSSENALFARKLAGPAAAAFLPSLRIRSHAASVALHNPALPGCARGDVLAVMRP